MRKSFYEQTIIKDKRINTEWLRRHLESHFASIESLLFCFNDVIIF